MFNKKNVTRTLLYFFTSLLFFGVCVLVSHKYLTYYKAEKELDKIAEEYYRNNVVSELSLLILDKQGVIQWRNGKETLPFERINLNSVEKYQNAALIYTKLGERWLIASKQFYSGRNSIGSVVVGKKIEQNPDWEKEEQSLHNILLEIVKNTRVVNDEIQWTKESIYPEVNGIVILNSAGTPKYLKGYLPLRLELYPIEFLYTKNSNTTNIYSNASLEILTINKEIEGEQLLLVAVYKKQLNLINLGKALLFAFIPATLITLLLTILFPNNQQIDKGENYKKNFVFIPKEGKLIADQREVLIPYDTNQYYLLKELSKKGNNWQETDYLSEKIFGEEIDTKKYQRAIYDAARLINQKSNEAWNVSIIDISSKRYRINQRFTIESQ